MPIKKPTRFAREARREQGSEGLDIVRHLLESAEAQIRSAKELLTTNTEKQTRFARPLRLGIEASEARREKLKFADLEQKASELNVISEGKIIEGVFDGEMMLGPDKKRYPVPANYASKSKFVPGDILKLTIQDDGSFVYKQIKPIERKKLVGSLTYENNQYKVLANGKTYKVLLASVTYFKLKPGDSITIAIPAAESSEWAAIENAAIGGE